MRYLKGEADFRGVTMAHLRAEVDRIWLEEVESWPLDDAFELALGFVGQPLSDDKLAGVLLLAEKLLPQLGRTDLPRLARPFEEGSIADWSVCDWFAVKVLAPLCRRDGRDFAEPLAAWTQAESLWQRRAPAAALAVLAGKPAPFAGFAQLAVTICGPLVADPQRFSQTAVGWLMRELSKTEPDVVRRFVERHTSELSREARRMAMAKLEGRGRR